MSFVNGLTVSSPEKKDKAHRDKVVAYKQGKPLQTLFKMKMKTVWMPWQRGKSNAICLQTKDKKQLVGLEVSFLMYLKLEVVQ